jgi:mannosylglycoprotein endo-beta-mannosidase
MQIKYVIICLLTFIIIFQQGWAKDLPQHVKLTGDNIREYNWKMKASSELNETGERISSLNFDDSGWMPAKVPGTVLDNLVRNGISPEPYFGLNNKISQKLIPDIHDKGRQFYTYWFRKTFSTESEIKGQKWWMQFDGINYIAHIWLNGKHLGEMKGMFCPGLFDVTYYLKFDGENVLAVEVEPVEHPGTFETVKKDEIVLKENRNGGNGEIGKDVTMLMSIGWDFTFSDGIRDRNTGISRDINLFSTDNIKLSHPFVKSVLSHPDYDAAELNISVDVHNSENESKEITLSGKIKENNVLFSKKIILKGRESRTITFDASEYKQLFIKKPNLWWPVNKGNQFLYTLNLNVAEGENISDELTTSFGIREITSDTNTPDGSRIFYVNGKRIFIRGSNWIPEAMLRTSTERMETEMRFTRQAGINMLRIWGGGISESDQFFELCDKYGILVWHEFWMTGDTKPPVDNPLYFRNVEETILRIRNHPSLAYYVSSNEQESVLDIQPILNRLDGTRGYQHQSECCGVHDGSPYKYENPMQYFDNTASDRGSRIDGFCPEYGTVCLPPIECLREMMEEKDIWPVNKDVWNYLDGNGFHNMTTKYLDAINQFGAPTSAEDLALKGQLVGAAAYRSIWENWNYNKFEAGDRFCSGLLFWYHNSPVRQVCSRMWDWSLEPTAALYATQNALEPLHAQFDFIKNTVSVINDLNLSFSNLTVTAELYNLSSKLISSEKKNFNISADEVVNDLIMLDFPSSISPVHFIRLILTDTNNKQLAETFYWRSNNEYKGPWTTTGPLYASFEALETLPQTEIECETKWKSENGKTYINLNLLNNSEILAFFTRIKLLDSKTGKLVRPVFYSDNYFSMVPGTKRLIKLEIPFNLQNPKDVKLIIEGWNLKQRTITLK